VVPRPHQKTVAGRQQGQRLSLGQIHGQQLADQAAAACLLLSASVLVLHLLITNPPLLLPPARGSHDVMVRKCSMAYHKCD